MSSLKTNSTTKTNTNTRAIPMGIVGMEPIEVPAPAYHTPDIPTAYTCMVRKGGIVLSHGSQPPNCRKDSSFRLNEFQYCCVPNAQASPKKKQPHRPLSPPRSSVRY